MFEKILVPLDGSDHSKRALDIAIKLAKERDGRITLIHVYETSPGYFVHPEAPPLNISKTEEERIERSEALLASGEAKCKSEEVPVKSLLRGNNIVEQIVEEAEKGHVELIVMGARGVGRIREALLGSVSDGVVRKAVCPVLIVK